MARALPKTWKLALATGVPVGLGLALAATLASGPLAGIATFVAAFLFTLAIVAFVTLVHVAIATRGGARAPEGVLADEHAMSLEIGGTRADAWERAREAALGLSGAKLVSEDPQEGLLEVETSLGPYVQRIRLRLDGTTVAAIARHQPGRKLFDNGAAAQQLADLRAALERTRRTSTDEIERELVRRLAARARQTERP